MANSDKPKKSRRKRYKEADKAAKGFMQSYGSGYGDFATMNTEDIIDGQGFQEYYSKWFNLIFNELMDVRLNMLKYVNSDGTPFDLLNTHLLEVNRAFQNGVAVIGKNTYGKWMVFPATVTSSSANLNFTGNLKVNFTSSNPMFQPETPIMITEQSVQETKEELRGSYVAILNRRNYTMLPETDQPFITEIAKLVSENITLSKTNMMFQQTPYLLQGEMGGTTARQLRKHIFVDHNPFIEVKGLNPNQFLNRIDLSVPNLNQQFTQANNNWLSQFATHFGINSSNVDKKERLITPESTANLQMVGAEGKTYLELPNHQFRLLAKRGFSEFEGAEVVYDLDIATQIAQITQQMNGANAQQAQQFNQQKRSQ